MSISRPDQEFKVVINHEEQYCIWSANRPNLRGWQDAGEAGATGTAETCIRFIERATANATPRKLREQIEALKR
ncbi:MAG: MbtH family NRPS accessory protein [Gammaproteobacteria bacterium]